MDPSTNTPQSSRSKTRQMNPGHNPFRMETPPPMYIPNPMFAGPAFGGYNPFGETSHIYGRIPNSIWRFEYSIGRGKQEEEWITRIKRIAKGLLVSPEERRRFGGYWSRDLEDDKNKIREKWGFSN